MDAETRKAVEAARQAAKHANDTRANLRRRTPVASPPRERALADEIDRLHEAMAPIRSCIGHFPYEDVGERDEQAIRKASADLKYERKQIRKMQRG